MTYINRAIEGILKNRFDTSKSVAITGARQVGKTTMTTHMFPNISRINLKNLVLLNNAKEDPQGFLENLYFKSKYAISVFLSTATAPFGRT